jgi:hypothetical protein
MNRPRRRRFVRRAVMAVAGVVLLPAWYAISAASLIVATNAGWLPAALPESAILAYPKPLFWYSENSERPGALACRSLVGWAIKTGDRLDDGE